MPILRLHSPPEADSIYRRAADARRKGMMLRDNSPPGVYLQDDQLVVVGLGSGTYQGDGSASDTDAYFSDPESITYARSTPPTSPEMFSTSIKNERPFPIRASQGQSFMVPTGSAVQLHLSDLDPYELQQEHLYTLRMESWMTSPQPGAGPELRTFEMVADTGSSDTWIYSADVCKLVSVVSETGSVKYNIVPLKLNTRKSRVFVHNVRTLAQMRKEGVTSPEHENSQASMQFPDQLPHVPYVDGTTAILVDLQQELKITLVDCYDWNKTSNEKHGFEMSYRFALCDAASPGLLEGNDMDGVLGLNRARHMDALAHSKSTHRPAVRLPAFFRALKNSPDLIRAHYRETERGLTAYFDLRAPGIKGQSSWLALNTWSPELLGIEPEWTKIALCKVRWDPDGWNVPVCQFSLQLEIKSGATPPDRFKEAQSHEVKISEFNPPLNMCLDTGSTCTYMPESVTRKLTEVFGEDQAVQTRAPFQVPQWVDIKKSRIVLAFGNASAIGEKVTQHSFPFEYFICDSRRGGLIYPEMTAMEPSEGLARHFSILGLNFFHSNHVALHMPDEIDHYVGLASK